MVSEMVGRAELAISRVGAALDVADYDSGHVITGDNMKLSDIRILLDLAKTQQAVERDRRTGLAGSSCLAAELQEWMDDWARKDSYRYGILQRCLAALADRGPDGGRGEEMSDAEGCQRCGADNPAWSAPSPLWNAVMRDGSINGESSYGDMVCATCFMVLAEKRGIASLWRVSAEVVNVELETVTPSGRVWDGERNLWVDP